MGWFTQSSVRLEPQQVATLRNALGDVARCQGDYDRAEAVYQESLDLQRALGNQADVSAGLQYGGTAGISPEGAIGIGAGSPPGASIGGAGGLAGFAQTVLQPGVIVDLPLSNMTLNEGGQAALDGVIGNAPKTSGSTCFMA